MIREEVAKLVSKKAMRKLTLREAKSRKGFYSKLFCVPKPDGAWRPVINLKPMNRFVLKRNFRIVDTSDSLWMVKSTSSWLW